MVGSQSSRIGILVKKKRKGHQEGAQTKTQQEGSQLPTWRRHLTRNQACWHLGLGFLQKCEKVHFCCWSCHPPSVLFIMVALKDYYGTYVFLVTLCVFLINLHYSSFALYTSTKHWKFRIMVLNGKNDPYCMSDTRKVQRMSEGAVSIDLTGN